MNSNVSWWWMAELIFWQELKLCNDTWHTFDERENKTKKKMKRTTFYSLCNYCMTHIMAHIFHFDSTLQSHLLSLCHCLWVCMKTTLLVHSNLAKPFVVRLYTSIYLHEQTCFKWQTCHIYWSLSVCRRDFRRVGCFKHGNWLWTPSAQVGTSLGKALLLLTGKMNHQFLIMWPDYYPTYPPQIHT